MNLTEKGTIGPSHDENLKKLVTVAKGLEDTLLDYANFKPMKKICPNEPEVKEKVTEEKEKTTKFRSLIEKVFEFNQVYKKQREQKLSGKKGKGNANKIKIKFDDNDSERSSEESYEPTMKTEENVLRMIEDGTQQIFKVIRNGKEEHISPKQEEIQNAVHHFYELVKDVRSPKSQSGSKKGETPKEYDILGYRKRLSEILMKQEEGEAPIFDFNELKKLQDPLTPNALQFFNLFSKLKQEEEANNSYKKDDHKQMLPPMKNTEHLKLAHELESPRLGRDHTFTLSPLFSTTHHNGGFFNGFTPRGFTPSHFLDHNRGLGAFEDYLLRPNPMTPHLAAIDFQSKMDKMVDNLRSDIQGHDAPRMHEKSGLDLDIELINESIPHPTKTPPVGWFFFP